MCCQTKRYFLIVMYFWFHYFKIVEQKRNQFLTCTSRFWHILILDVNKNKLHCKRYWSNCIIILAGPKYLGVLCTRVFAFTIAYKTISKLPFILFTLLFNIFSSLSLHLKVTLKNKSQNTVYLKHTKNGLVIKC